MGFDRSHSKSQNSHSRYKRRSNYHDSDRDQSRYIDPKSPEYIRNMISTTGEKPNEDYPYLADSLLFEYAGHQSEILETLEICISELPAKTEIYAKLTAALNAKNPEFVQELLSSLGELLEIHYKRSAFNQVILILRFFLILGAMGIVSFSSLLDLLGEFNLKDFTSQPQKAALNYRILLCTLPFGGKALSDAIPLFVKEFIEGFSQISSEFSVSSDEIDKFAAPISCLAAFLKAFEAFDERISIPATPSVQQDLKRRNISSLNPEVGEFLSKSFVILPLEVQGSLFDRLICYENVRISLEFLPFNFKRAVDMISNDMNTNALREKEYVFALISNLLVLRHEGNPIANVEACIIHLCRIRPGVAPFLGKVIRYFFANAQEIKHSDLFVFTEWFADHLTNFDLKWNWNEWTSALEQEATQSSCRVLLEDLFDRISRLVFVERILQALPPAFSELVGILCSKNVDIHQWANDKEIESMTRNIRCKVNPQELLTGQFSATVFVRSLLLAGSSTISHSLVFLEMYKDVLGKVFSAEQGQDKVLLQEIFHFWKGNVQFFEAIVQKMSLYKIIKPSSFALWYLPVVAQELYKFKRWNVLFLLRGNLKLRIAQCQEKLTQIEEEGNSSNEQLPLLSNAIQAYKKEMEDFDKAVLNWIESVQSDSITLHKTLEAIKFQLTQ
jgi:hypothetical protein